LLQRLGQRIRELRNQKGWSQEEFADVCGVHRTYMGHLERGEKNLSFRSIMRVAAALEVPLSVLFKEIESAEPETGVSGPRRARPSIGKNQATLDRNRLRKELATMERSIHSLKELALAGDELKLPVQPPRGDKPTARSLRSLPLAERSFGGGMNCSREARRLSSECLDDRCHRPFLKHVPAVGLFVVRK
jgi:transcriptional regulator with XRE-family HTH domain